MGLPKGSFSFSKRYYGYLHIDMQTFLPTQYYTGLLSGSVVKNLPDNAGNTVSIPGSGRCPGEGNVNPLQFTCLEIPWIEEPGGLQSMGSQRGRSD